MEEERTRINTTQKWLLIGVAAFGDTLQAFLYGITTVLFPIPFVGQVIALLGWLFGSLLSSMLIVTFFVWFRVLGVSLFGSHKRVVAKIFAIVAETIPLPTGLFPFWTLVIIYQVRHIRAEDKKRNEEIRAREQREGQQRPSRRTMLRRNLSRAA